MASPLPFVEFLDHLRQRGFAVGLQQHQDLAKLCALRSEDLAQDPRLFLRSLTALLARSPEEVAELETLYGRYFAEALRGVALDSPGLASGRDQGLIQKQVAQVPAPRALGSALRQTIARRPWLVFSIVLALLALSIVGVRVVQRLRVRPAIPEDKPAAAPPPATGQRSPSAQTDAPQGPPKVPELPELPELPPARTELHTWQVVRLAVPLPAILFVLLYVRRRRADLQRWAKGYWRTARNTLGGYYEPKLDFESVLAPALSRADLDDMATILGRSDDRPPSRKLDGERSVRATAERGALPQLVFAQQPIARTVLILCDVAPDMALWQRKAQALRDGLSRRGVPVVLRYFNGDATSVSARPHGPRQPLEQVHKHDPEAALLVVSCGFQAQSPGRGLEPARWLGLLTRFRLRAWLIPICDKRKWRPVFSADDFPLRALPMTRKGLLAAAYELAQERERRRHIGQADAPPDRLPLPADADRLRRLLTVWPDAPLGLAEVLRQNLCPDIPESALIEVWTSSEAASSNRLRWELSDRARWYRELQQEDARYQSWEDLPKRQEERARRLILRLLHAARPQTDPQDARFLSWRLACALQQIYLHDRDEHSVRQALATLAELSQGPLWEDVADALDPLGVPMLPRPRKHTSLPLSEPVREQLQTQVVRLIRRTASGHVHVPSQRKEGGRAASAPPTDLRRPSWFHLPGLRELVPVALLFGLCAFAAYQKGIGSERIENSEAYRIEVEADPTASRCNESAQVGLILRTSRTLFGPDFSPHSVLLCDDPACTRNPRTVALTDFETPLRIDRPSKDRAYHLRRIFPNRSIAYSKQHLIAGYTPPAMAELTLRARSRSGRVISERIPFSATDAAGCSSRGFIGETMRVRAGAVLLSASLTGYGSFDQTVQLKPNIPLNVDVTFEPLVPPGMVRIPAGSFLMGSNDGKENEKPVHRVTLPEFFLDKTEVTLSDYQRCVAAGRCVQLSRTVQLSNVSSDDVKVYSQFCNINIAGRGRHPVNCVNWDQTNAYCKWADKRLPSEAEWEYAARGTDRRIYPWGNAEPRAGLLNACGMECIEMFNKHNRTSEPMYKAKDGYEMTAPVGSIAGDKSPFGIMDMAGNVTEWVSDYYSDNYKKSGNRTNRVLRGGSWDDFTPANVRAAYRYRFLPSDRSSGVGFRCARTAE